MADAAGLAYEVEELEFDNREEAADWIDANQLGRRNLKPDQMSLIRGRRYNRTKKAVGGNGANQHSEQLDQNDPIAKSTAQRLATQHGVSAPTIKRDGAFAAAVEKVKAVDPEIEKKVTENTAPAKSAVIKAAKLLDEHPEQAKAVLLGERSVAGAHVGNNSGDNEWYTPAEYIVAGMISVSNANLS